MFICFLYLEHKNGLISIWSNGKEESFKYVTIKFKFFEEILFAMDFQVFYLA